ncbi:MAG: sensor histidine kinase [bacterium]
MNPAFVGRRVQSVAILATLLVVVAGLLELASVVRLATERAATECDLVTHVVRRQLDFIAVEEPAADLRAIARDSRLATVLSDAIAHAPSALHVAVCDTSGTAVAHSLVSEIGRPIARLAPLPRARNLADAFRVLWQLREGRSLYESFTPLARNDEPFASIRVIVPRAFLWDSVKSFFWRGVVVAVAFVALAIGGGVIVSRLVIGRLRVFEAGVTAIREGRFDGLLPESGADEFSRLARELNLLAKQFERERRAFGAGQDALNALADQTRVLTRLGEMATGVAHELRDPLQALSLDLDAAARAARRDPAEVEAHVRSAAEKIGRLDRAISGFLKIARLRPTAVQRIRVNDFVAEIHATLESDANLAGLDLELDLAPSAPDIVADPQVLRQAVYNLVRNAIQAGPSRDKRIVLRTWRETLGAPESGGGAGLAANAPGTVSRACIAVADTGPGIPPELRERVLELFFTTKPDGTGVGLSLARQAAEMHGGELEIESATGVGTVVTIKLPAAETAIAMATGGERGAR